MKVIILAAGYGTRLYPLTLELPKSLIPVNNKPVINFSIDKVSNLRKKIAIDEVKVVSNNKFYKDFLRWKEDYKIEGVQIINDGSNTPCERLGAIKDIKFAIDKSKKDDWLIIGGDNLFEDDLVDFLKFAVEKKPFVSVGLYEVFSKKEACRFGVVRLNEEQQLIELKEKPKIPFSTLIATCLYFLPQDSLDFLEKFIQEEDGVDAAGKYISWLIKQFKVFGYKLNGRWIDIGHYDALKEAEREFVY